MKMTESITLKDVWHLLKKSWAMILAVAIIGGLLAGLFTVFFIPKMYTSSVTIYVSNATNSTTGNVNSGDLTASQLLANTSVQLLLKEPARKMICDKLSVVLTTKQLGGFVKIKQTAETELLTIFATTRDPILSAEICNAYADIAPEYLQGIIKAGSFQAVDEAEPALAPSSPSVQKNVIIGALIAGAVCFGIYFIIFVFDNSVKDGDEIKRRLHVPVLGEVPAFTGQGK